jgi:hypothetical protein
MTATVFIRRQSVEPSPRLQSAWIFGLLLHFALENADIPPQNPLAWFRLNHSQINFEVL